MRRQYRRRAPRESKSLRNAKQIGSLSISMNELKHDSITRLQKTLTRLQKTTREYFKAKEDFSYSFSCREFGLSYTASNLVPPPPVVSVNAETDLHLI